MSLALRSHDQVFGDESGAGDPEAIELSLDRLALGPSPRKSGVRPEHVRALAQLEGRWPPILVNRSDLTIIDGAHRFHAARLLGHKRVWCFYFDGDPEEAFLEAIRRNTRHGLPLTLREREDAAAQLLSLHQDWSNRRVAELCALAHGTVSKIREQFCPTGEAEQLNNKRIGRDGRVRPVDSTETRKRIAEALASTPQATAREIAAQVGASPTTVASVRSKLRHASGIDETQRPSSNHAPTASGYLRAIEPSWQSESTAPDADQAWRTDISLSSTPEQQQFLTWFEKTGIGEEWAEFINTPPLSRVYELADEARRRAKNWEKFAKAIESRSCPSRAR